MIVTTIESEQIWTSPDESRTIWRVILKGADGQQYELKTYSRSVSEVGFKGDVESYVSERGERFVRQVRREDNRYAKR